MSTVTTTAVRTLADVLADLGDVPLSRVRATPPPGTATETDVLAQRNAPAGRLCELVDGTLVEKAMGTREALLGGLILHLLWAYLEEHDLGQALPGDGFLRLAPGMVRVPDVSFIRWEQLPGGELPDEPIAELHPDFVVEVLSESNTPAEMRRKVREYFDTGTRLLWVIDPRKQTARSYTSPDESRAVGKSGVLDGGEVLPGFRVSLKDLFLRTRPRSPGKP